MLVSYPADRPVVIDLSFTDYSGNPVTPDSATYTLFDRSGALAENQAIDLSGGVPSTLTIPGILNQVDSGMTRGYRRVELTYVSDGATFVTSQTYLLERSDRLVVGDNSFATLPDLLLTAADMIELRAFHNASETRQVSALIGAWHNLGQLPVQFEDLEGTDRYELGTTVELIDTDLALLQPKTLRRLLRAQVIEANDLLGGNPIEARRRLGLISDSAGESAHFFRTAKPLNLPACREAVDELRGIVSWGVRVGRG